MPSAPSDPELLPILRGLTERNAADILGRTGDDVRVQRLRLGGRRHERTQRHHRRLSVRFLSDGTAVDREVWLKFVTAPRRRYDVHATAWARTRGACPMFPQPYFFAEWQGGGLVGMEVVEGTSLRSLFLRGMLARRTPEMNATFTALGRALRVFHDAAEPEDARPVTELEERMAQLIADTGYLARPDRERLAALVAGAVERAGGGRTRLPLIPIHHDCVIKNVVVRADGSVCLLDLDSMCASRKSRWYDVVVFLINLESQIKYAPLSDGTAIREAWRAFWTGYTAAGPPDGLAPEQITALLFLVKAEYLLGGTWRPLFEIYTGTLAARYVRRLTASLLQGQHLALGWA
jgi:hypothetical protein